MRNGLWHGVVHNVSNIGFVYPHPKGNCGAEHADSSQTPLTMTPALLMRVQVCMIKRHPYIAKSLLSELLVQLIAYVFTVLATKTIDDS